MDKFKAGDQVKRIAFVHEGMKVGDVAVVKSVADGWNMYLEGYSFAHDPQNFELVTSADEKEAISKFLRENKWFIRTGSPEKSKLVQEWLFEHGMKWQWYNDFNNNTNEKLLTNTYDDGDKNNYILFAADSNKTNAQEIKIEFETIMKSVQLPQVLPKKTEAQLKLEELQRTIEDAQRQIAQLKEEIK